MCVCFLSFYFGFVVCLFVSWFPKEKEREGMGLDEWKSGEDLGEEGGKNVIRAYIKNHLQFL